MGTPQQEKPQEASAEQPETANKTEETQAQKIPAKLEELTSKTQRPEKGGRVCITYGRDEIMNRQVVSLIRELGVDPLVMQDKNNIGKPIAQFYTENPDIAFTVAILSADDWVYPKNGKPKDALLYADQRVIFHLGFWIGRLGRNNVYALYYDQKSFRWPTEHFDIIYTPLDKKGNWKTELVARLRSSGIEVKEK